MKANALGLLMVACLATASPAFAAGKVKTIGDIHAIPKRILERMVSPTLYKTLMASPVQGWIAVRGALSETHIRGAKVIHSAWDHAYDDYALMFAKNVELRGMSTVGQINSTVPVLLYMIICRTPQGTVLVSFPCIDFPGGEQLEYYGSARLQGLQPDGTWKDIPLPNGSYGTWWAVSQPDRPLR